MESHSHGATGKVSFRTTSSLAARPRGAMDLWDSRTALKTLRRKRGSSHSAEVRAWKLGSSLLPVEKMVGLGRVELPTRSLGNCCSIHLSYSPADRGPQAKV